MLPTEREEEAKNQEGKLDIKDLQVICENDNTFDTEDIS